LGVERYLTYSSFALTDRVSSRMNLCNGNLITQYSALNIPSRGLSLHLVFTYNSLTNHWTHTYAASLAEQGNGDVIFGDGDGTQHLFTHQANGSYDAPAGIFDTPVKNGDDSFTLTHTDQSAHLFEPNPLDATLWRLYEVRDRHNNIVTLTYSNGALQQVTAAAGQSLQFFYYADGKLQRVEDNYTPARALTLAYQPNGRLKTFTDPMSHITEFAYGGGHLETITDPRLYNTTIGYDANDRVDTLARHTIQVAAFDYTTNTTRITDGENHTTTYALNSIGLVEQITAPPTTNNSSGESSSGTTEYGYDGDYNINYIKDARGYETWLTYDGSNLRFRENARHEITEYFYTPENDLWKIKDARSNWTIYTYQNGNLISVTDDLNNITEYEYNAYGQRTSVRDANAVFENRNDKTIYEYDPDTGYLKSVTDALGELTTYTYTTATGTSIKSRYPGAETRMSPLILGNPAHTNCVP
jgi:YD repeat-containing protein